jgi:NADH:ubiquinone oxidoreductase subunit 4 (subunit M)
VRPSRSALIPFVLSLLLLAGFDAASTHAFQAEERLAWIPTWGIGYTSASTA